MKIDSGYADTRMHGRADARVYGCASVQMRRHTDDLKIR